MILDPKQLVNDINVYLSLLIEDLRVLWEEGLDINDRYSGETFKLCYFAQSIIFLHTFKGHKMLIDLKHFPIFVLNF